MTYQPKPGDRVRISYECEYVEHNSTTPHLVTVRMDNCTRFVPADATFEMVAPPEPTVPGTVVIGEGGWAWQLTGKKWYRYGAPYGYQWGDVPQPAQVVYVPGEAQ